MGDRHSDDDPTGLADLTAFQRDMLRFLAREDHRKGAAIRSRLEAYDGVDVNNGRLYPNLDQPGENTFLAKSRRNRRTDDYALTNAASEKHPDYSAWLGGESEWDT